MVAEQAIASFEASTGLQVVVHDLGAGFDLPHDRGQHRTPCCQIVKRSSEGWRCYALEVTELRQDWRRWPEGRIHRCHAGFIEWLVPLVWADELLGFLFAGQGHGASAPEGCCDLIQPTSPASTQHRQAVTRRVASPTEARHLLEQLRQLAARLLLLGLPPQQGSKRPFRRSQLDRRAKIDLFLHIHHDIPGLCIDDLAKNLQLSPSRTAHVLQETHGLTFVQLLTAARLQRACELLEHTDLPVHAVGITAGFSDQAHFHRVFKKHVQTTPRRWRQQQE